MHHVAASVRNGAEWLASGSQTHSGMQAVHGAGSRMRSAAAVGSRLRVLAKGRGREMESPWRAGRWEGREGFESFTDMENPREICETLPLEGLGAISPPDPHRGNEYETMVLARHAPRTPPPPTRDGSCRHTDTHEMKTILGSNSMRISKPNCTVHITQRPTSPICSPCSRTKCKRLESDPYR